MSYVKKNLIIGEILVYQGKISRWIYFPALVILGGGLGLTVISAGSKDIRYLLLGVLIIIYGMAKLILAFVRRFTTELSVTNKRVVGKKGFIKRQSIDVRLDKIESILINQGFIGRLLDYGDIGVKGSGGTIDSMPDFDSPMVIRKKFMEALEANSHESVS